MNKSKCTSKKIISVAKFVLRPILLPPLRLLNRFYFFSIRFLNKRTKIKYLNLGGGSRFCKIGWLNLDQLKSANALQMDFNEKCIFPLKDASIELVYSSHCFEHLEEKTILHILDESRRVLKQDKDLVLKLPDFDNIVLAWRNNDKSYFSDQWDFASCIPTWKSRGVVDSIDNRASTIFCGFWNKAYGDHFSGKNKNTGLAYHGPAVVSSSFLADLKKLPPRIIAKKLRQEVMNNEKDYHFNHQTAFSKNDIIKILKDKGFSIVSKDDAEIIRSFNNIPGITQMKNMSMYVWAKKG